MEKITLSRIREDLEHLDEVVGDDGYTRAQTEMLAHMPEAEHPIITECAVINGHRMTRCWCTNCGTEYTAESDDYPDMRCPHCGNSRLAAVTGYEEYLYFLNESPDDEYKRFIIASPKEQYEYGSTEVRFSFIGWRNSVLGAFTPELGFRFLDNGRLRTSKSRSIYGLSTIKLLQPEFTGIVEKMQAEQNSLDGKAREKRDHKPAPKIRTFEIPLTPVDDIIPRYDGHAAIVQEQKGYHVNKVWLYCNQYGKTVSTDYDDRCCVCPCCGKVIEDREITGPYSIDTWAATDRPSSSKMTWIDSAADKKGNTYVVARELEFLFSLKPGSHDLGITGAKEHMRVYFGERKATCVNISQDGTYTVEKKTYRLSERLIQSDDEIISRISESSLARSGWAESIQKGNRDLLLRYPTAYYRTPQIEQVTKAGLTELAKSMIFNEDVIENPEETELKKMLGVTNAEYKMIRELNPDVYDLREFHALYGLDPTITPELYKEFRWIIGRERLIAVMRDTGVRLKDIMEYIQRVEDHQCIPQYECITIWSDYITMAKDMHYDLKDRSRLFPASLKLEHDKAVYAYKVVQDDLESAKFTLRAHDAEWLEYSNQHDGFEIRVPQTADEVVSEGNTLKHCVASYVGQIRNGSTNVVFIRKIDEPDKPFYTVEVKNRRITQLRGYCNRTATSDVRRFVNHWAAARHLAIAA